MATVLSSTLINEYCIYIYYLQICSKCAANAVSRNKSAYCSLGWAGSVEKFGRQHVRFEPTAVNRTIFFCLLQGAFWPPGQETEDPELEAQLAMISECNAVDKGAEEDLELNMKPEQEQNQDHNEANPDKEDEVMELEIANPGESEDEEIEYDFSTGVNFVCDGPSGVSSSDPSPPIAVAPPSASFKDMPAFVFLEKLNLTELPHVNGAGIGVHVTIQAWQVRYPPSGSQKASCARSWGNLSKKGFVSQCKALLECLLWAWERHLAENPSCSVSQTKVGMLKGALIADLGRDLEK